MKKENTVASLFTVTEVELVYHNKVNPNDRPRLTSSRHVYDVLLNAWDKNKIELLEQFSILLLDRSNHCLGISHVSTGGVSVCAVDPKIIFATALKARACALILAHNHPSGNLTPSPEDKRLTQRLVEGGKVLDILVLDHLIVTPRNYLSFADEELMPCEERRYRSGLTIY